MGCSTYIYGNDKKSSSACLGKLVAYVKNPLDDLPNLMRWLNLNVTDEDDRTYLFGGIDEEDEVWEGFCYLGYSGETVIFKQSFNREQISEFVTSFIRDKSKSPFPHFSSDFYRDLGKLLDDNTSFTIEWTEGG